MTSGVPDAELSAKLTVDSKDTSREVGDALDDAGRKNERKAKDLGEKLGAATSEGMAAELERSGPEIGHALDAGIARAGVGRKISKRVFEFDPEGNVVKAWVTVTAAKMAQEVSSGGAKSLFSAVGDIIGQAVGSGFNVSGRSKLIILLIPVLGAIVYLVGALVQAAGALVAYLYLIPSLLGGIILQVGILFIAFQGMGEAISGAFAAKNAWELNQAIKGLPSYAQEFVRSLLPLKDLFNFFKYVIQQNFFRAIGDSVGQLVEAINKIGVAPIGALAGALGNLLGTVLKFFNDPAFQTFIHTLIPSTERWVNGFAQALLVLLTGLADLGTAVQPFLDSFGEGFNKFITDLGLWLTSLKDDPEFLAFLTDAKETMKLFGDSLQAALVWLKDFWQAFKESGGDRLIQGLTDGFETLSNFLDDKLGTESLEGLIHTLEALTFVFFILLLGLFAVFAALEMVAEFIRHGLGPAIGNFFYDLWENIKEIWNSITGFFSGLDEKIGEFFSDLGSDVTGIGSTIVNALETGWNALLTFLQGLPDRARDALVSLRDSLFQRGRELIQRLMDGIREELGPLGNLMLRVAGTVADHLPNSPAKMGPLSGDGDPLKSGQEIVNRLVAGIRMEAPELQVAGAAAAGNITFGPGAVAVNFNGALPTQQQAFQLGSSTGTGIASVLSQRNTRLAIRSMGTY